jgi:2-keto-4-pentenoate hydratase/2-oxohepta-3-ene-1,7-dioic acid hydratase in catechol pathway
MKYCRFKSSQGVQFGNVESRDGEEKIVSLLSPDLIAQKQGDFKPIKLADAQLLPAVAPGKLVCVGRNYSEHAKEFGNEPPTEPLLFLKPPSAVIAPGEAIELPPAGVSQRVDFEGELAVVIGKRMRKLKDSDDVRGYIRGYTCANDVTARDLQNKDDQWTRAKGFDTFCPLGPVVSDELDPWKGVELVTRLNGEVRQRANTRDFIFALDHVLRYISQVMTLEPGDVVLTGTPSGVGPMKSGDQVEVEIAGVGVLRNRVQ